MKRKPAGAALVEKKAERSARLMLEACEGFMLAGVSLEDIHSAVDEAWELAHTKAAVTAEREETKH